MVLLFFYLFLALIVSFLCSVMEAVLLSTPVSFLKVREAKGSTAAKQLIALKKDIDRPLSAILSLNTIAHTIGAAGVGAQATRVFGEVYFGIVSAILTILILIFSEIIPKTIGAKFWRKLAIPAGQAIRATILLTWPLVIIAAFITRLFSKNYSGRTTSGEEISALARIAKEEGVFGERERKVIQNIIRLKSVKASEVMTPRVVVSAADENMILEDFPRNKSFLFFSRIPVYSESFDNVTGYILRQSVFEKLAASQGEMKLKDIKRDILVVPEGSPIFLVWEKLLGRKEHIALVVDEYGGMSGIVTMEDIIETLLGFEIIDERDTIANMQQYARERWDARQAQIKFLDQYNNPEKK